MIENRNLSASDADSIAAEVALSPDDEVILQRGVAKLLANDAYFELLVVSPQLPVFSPYQLISPKKLSDDEYEFVYDIQDHGNRFLTARSLDMFSHGSMCKLYFTIEKIIFLLMERLRESEGGLEGTELNAEVNIEGYFTAKRKAFESIINLKENVVVNNFDPEIWGDFYLQWVNILSTKGWGAPPTAPRDFFSTHPSKISLKSR